jgi:polyhydroxyalkanoate synthesis regulator phasin
MQGIEKDARIILDEMVDNGKKALDNLPVKKKFQKKIENRIKSVPLPFNLPTRKDINMLMDRLANLNTKIDTLGKAYTA